MNKISKIVCFFFIAMCFLQGSVCSFAQEKTFDAERETLLITIKRLNRENRINEEKIKTLTENLEKKSQALSRSSQLSQELKKALEEADQYQKKIYEQQRDLAKKDIALENEKRQKNNFDQELKRVSQMLEDAIAEKEALKEKNLVEPDKEFALKELEIFNLTEELQKEKNRNLELEQQLNEIKQSCQSEKKDWQVGMAFSEEEKKALSLQLMRAETRVKKLQKKMKEKSKRASMYNLGNGQSRDDYANPDVVAYASKQAEAYAQDLPSEARVGKNLSFEDKKALDKHYNLGIFYGRSGMYVNEEIEYLECLNINPYDPDVHYNLAILYDDQLNQNAKAIEHYKKYLEYASSKEDFDVVKKWILAAEEEMRMGADLK